MLIKIGIRLTLALLLFSTVLMALALLMGRLTDPLAVSVLFNDPLYLPSDIKTIHFIDPSRNLRADHHLPFSNARRVDLWNSNTSLIVATYVQDAQASHYERGLYLYNIFTGEIIPLTETRSDRYIAGDFDAIYRFGDKLAFFAQADKGLYLFDFKTGQKMLLTHLQDNASYPYMSASSDNTYLAFNPRLQKDNRLLIYTAEGELYGEYNVEMFDFYPEWTLDNQYIALRRSRQILDEDLKVIRASDGTPHPFTEGIKPIWFTLSGCNGKWLTYVRYLNGEREGYILNMQTGETVRVNDHPMLAGQRIEAITPQADCEHFLVEGYIRTATGFSPVMKPIYLINSTLTDVRLVDDSASLFSFPNPSPNAIYYQKDDPNTHKTTIYQRSLNPYGAPVVLAECETIDTYSQWSDDLSTMLFLINNNPRLGNTFTGQLAAMDVASGKTRLLSRENENVYSMYLYRWNEMRERAFAD